MDKIVQETYLATLNSNLKFRECIDDEKKIIIDKNIICELISLFNLINNRITKCGIEFFDYDYIIDGTNVIVNGKSYSINSIVDYITKNNDDYVYYKDNTIDYNGNNIPSSNRKSKKQPINFTEMQRKINRSMRNSLYLEQEINNDNISFITKTRNDFNYLINSIIKKILIQGNTEGIDSMHLYLLYGLLNIFLNTIYNKKLPLESIHNNHNEIRIIKDCYSDEYINNLEQEIQLLLNQKMRCLDRIYYLNSYSLDYGLAYAINKQMENIDSKMNNLKSQLVFLKDNPLFFNNFIFTTIKKAIVDNNIEFRDGHINPILTIFTNNGNEIDSIIEMHLTTFVELINNNEVLNIYTNQSGLKKKKKSK